MPNFGKRSKELRQYLCKDLKRLVDEVIKTYDFSIVETVRGQQAQENDYELGRTKAHYGQSAHNYNPCFAVDVYPWPCPRKQDRGIIVIDDDSHEWKKMTDAFKRTANKLGIKITCGIDFKSFRDAPHIELAGWREKVKEI